MINTSSATSFFITSATQRWRDYAQLVRLPNVFTAIADICVGVLAVETQLPGSLPNWWGLRALLLMVSSACLYCGGMVWNDYFDIEQDRRERPFRPLPSGRISRKTAGRLGMALLVGGMFFAFGVGWQTSGWQVLSLTISAVLVGAILLYDRWLKRTLMGPVGMGTCRFLNILLGFSIAGHLPAWSFHCAIVVGFYIVGVTWFARTEARISNRRALAGAAVVMLSALVILLPVPLAAQPGSSSALFPYLWVTLVFAVGFRVCRAMNRPTPKLVQAAVKAAIFGLIGVDTLLAIAFAGSSGLVLLLLLFPAMHLGKWIYST